MILRYCYSLLLDCCRARFKMIFCGFMMLASCYAPHDIRFASSVILQVFTGTRILTDLIG
jgi:hypothetical protein